MTTRSPSPARQTSPTASTLPRRRWATPLVTAIGLAAGLAFAATGWVQAQQPPTSSTSSPTAANPGATSFQPDLATTASTSRGTAKAIFAGGCFWCVESDFDKVPGVLATTSGYIGGSIANPTYGQVSSKLSGHAEVVMIEFDPKRVSYAQLLELYWRSIDPTTKDRQFCDSGSPYRTAIFTLDPQQLAAAQASRAALDKSKPFKDPIVTEIVEAGDGKPGGKFYAAEGYHQDYYMKNPLRYQYYRTSCGRDARLKQLWGAQAIGH